MKTRLMLCYAAAGLLLLQGCSKNQTLKLPTTGSPGTQLKANAISGSYGSYEIYNVASSKCMEVTGGSVNYIAGVGQWDYYAGGTSGATNPAFVNQVWQVIDQGTGYYKIMNLKSGQYLEAAFPGPQLWQNKADGLDAELWQIIVVGYGAYQIINKANGLAVTNHASSTTNGTPITVETYATNSSQWWVFTPVTPAAYRDDSMMGFFQRTSGSTAFDGGSSIGLTYGSNNGKVFWQTNDTFWNGINANGSVNCLGGENQPIAYRNSGLIQPSITSLAPASTVNVTSPDGVEIFHDSNAANLFWPSNMIEISNHIYVECIEVIRGGLTTVNQYLCDITEGTGTTIASVVPRTVPNMTGQTNIVYTIGMAKPGDGYVYVYGTGGFLGAGVYVARFATGSPTSWTFWNGTSWASTPTNATSAQVASGPVNNNTVGYVNGKYVLVEMDFGFSCDESSRNIYTLTSTSPTGPFANKQTVYILPDVKQGHYPVFYNPTIHSEFVNGHNELLVNYCVNFYNKNDGTNATCLPACSNPDGTEDPNDYRPKPVRIPFSLIGL